MRRTLAALALLLLPLAAVSAASAQRVISAPEGSIIVVKGQTALVVQQVPLQRLSIADPEIAEVFAISPREVMVNGKELGSTSLLLWDANGGRLLYTVEVMPDTASLRQTIRQRINKRGELLIVLDTSEKRLVLRGRPQARARLCRQCAAAHRLARFYDRAGRNCGSTGRRGRNGPHPEQRGRVRAGAARKHQPGAAHDQLHRIHMV